MDRNLIFDVGLHIGQDTDFYLKKGFKVVAIDANPVLIDAAKVRFSAEIESGQLRLLNVGIGEAVGKFSFGASGPFGEETPGEWLSESAVLEQINAYWGNPQRDPNIHGWFDLHGKLASA